jgi:uncharacterized protein (DUF1330 family)
MPAYFVGVINIKNHEAYAAQAIGPGRASVEAHGGTPLVIGDVKESMDGSGYTVEPMAQRPRR